MNKVVFSTLGAGLSQACLRESAGTMCPAERGSPFLLLLTPSTDGTGRHPHLSSKWYQTVFCIYGTCFGSYITALVSVDSVA